MKPLESPGLDFSGPERKLHLINVTIERGLSKRQAMRERRDRRRNAVLKFLDFLSVSQLGRSLWAFVSDLDIRSFPSGGDMPEELKRRALFVRERIKNRPAREIFWPSSNRVVKRRDRPVL